jgi:hypothetical protein
MESARSGHAIYWLDEPPEFYVKDGYSFCTMRSDGKTIELRSTTPTFLVGMGNASRAYVASLAAATVAQILPFRARQRDH